MAAWQSHWLNGWGAPQPNATVAPVGIVTTTKASLDLLPLRVRSADPGTGSPALFYHLDRKPFGAAGTFVLSGQAYASLTSMFAQYRIYIYKAEFGGAVDRQTGTTTPSSTYTWTDRSVSIEVAADEWFIIGIYSYASGTPTTAMYTQPTATLAGVPLEVPSMTTWTQNAGSTIWELLPRDPILIGAQPITGFSTSLLVPGVANWSTTRSTLAPDTIAGSSNLTGAVTAIQESPDSLDASWLEATSPTTATNLRVTFPTPPTEPIGPQKFRVAIRRAT